MHPPASFLVSACRVRMLTAQMIRNRSVSRHGPPWQDPWLDVLERGGMCASVLTGTWRPRRLRDSLSEGVMVTRTRWTVLSAARGSALDAWLRRKRVDEKQRRAALHEWENEGGTQETSPSDLARGRAEAER